MSWIRARIDRLRYVWRMALEENATPEKFALAVALGIFIAGSPVPPLFGARTATAGCLAWVSRLNRLTACISVHLLFPITWLIILLELQLGCFVLGRPIPVLSRNAVHVAQQAMGAMLAWTVGSLFVAPVMATIAGFIAYPISKRYLARRAERRAAAIERGG